MKKNKTRLFTISDDDLSKLLELTTSSNRLLFEDEDMIQIRTDFVDKINALVSLIFKVNNDATSEDITIVSEIKSKYLSSGIMTQRDMIHMNDLWNKYSRWLLTLPKSEPTIITLQEKLNKLKGI